MAYSVITKRNEVSDRLGIRPAKSLHFIEASQRYSARPRDLNTHPGTQIVRASRQGGLFEGVSA
jgi:hypothetical protein